MTETDDWRGYEWVALSVTTVGALLASIQGSAFLVSFAVTAFAAVVSTLRPSAPHAAATIDPAAPRFRQNVNP